MKIFLAILTGFILTLTTYAGGIMTAIFFLDADPVPVPVRSPGVDAAEVSTRNDERVDAVAQNLERLQNPPIRKISPSADPETDESETDEPEMGGPEVTARAEPLLDTTTTSAIPTEDILEPEEAASEPEAAQAPAMNEAHVRWCFERYRSYRPEDNSYTAYSGEKRACVSPFGTAGGDGVEIRAEASVDRPFVGYAVEDEEPSGYLTQEHVQSCFDRYRSYRPEDNSYQPYGGGPRRQCR